jgi:hypothetical protein
MTTLTNENIRAKLITTIFGRRLGLTSDGYLGGPKDIQKRVQDVQTTVGTTVGPDGVVRVLTSGSSQLAQHELAAPVPGVELVILLNSTSTGSQQFLSTPAGASIFNATAGTTANAVNLVGPGGSVTLIGLTTAVWGVKALAGSTASGGTPTFTTST